MATPAPGKTPRTLIEPLAGLGLAVLLGCGTGASAQAQAPAAGQPAAAPAATVPAPAAAAAPRAVPPGPAASAPATVRKPAPARPPNGTALRDEAGPTWAELKPVQQQVLAPLGASWKSLSEAHKRKWIALAEGYPRMTPEDQGRLRSRMTEWAAMSPQQRTQARLNFQESNRVSPVDKKAKWEAYQALPVEEKRRLAAGAAAVKPPPPPTAPAVSPVPPQKLARVPKAEKGDARAPRIAAAPETGSPHTLVPAEAPANDKR
jgi:hypothetical protein